MRPVFLFRLLTALSAVVVVGRPAVAQRDAVELVVVATTDIHGRVYHWNYQQDAEAPWGLTRAATVVDSLRSAYPGRVIVVDAGDLIEGNPLATYFATVSAAPTHPVVDALNGVGYDVATLGNHDFDFGLDVLARAVTSAAFPFVSANVYRLPRDTLAYAPFVVLQRAGVRVGVTGVTTPGVMVWDRRQVDGRIAVRRIPDAARRVLEQMTEAGVDLRIVLAHSGLGGGSSYDTTGVGAENAAAALATLSTKPDLVIVGHTHRVVRDSIIGGVHFVQPREWARALAVTHVTLVPAGGGYRVSRIRSDQVSLAGVRPDPVVTDRLEAAHDVVRTWVNRPLARIEGRWISLYARAEDTPIVDFVNEVQRQTAGTELSATSVVTPSADFGPYEVRLRDVAALYPYENTLTAVRIDGARLRAYLEQSATYFRTYRAGEPILAGGVPGYNFDIVSGVDYVIDLTRPVGQRIRQLTYHGRLVAPTDTFTLALNSYRQTGAGGFEMLRGLPMVYRGSRSIRDLLTDRIRSAGVLRAEDYFTPSWRIIPDEARDAVRGALYQAAHDE